jgi:hypothetical protein
MSFKALSLAALAAAASAAPLAAQAAPAPASTSTVAVASAEPTLEELRALTERYRDVNVAIADGYVRDPSNTCETADMVGRDRADGVMGIHYAHMGRLGVTAPPNPKVDGNGIHTDFRAPSVLIYEPQADGSLELVAVENLVFIKAWEAAGHKAPPSYLGNVFNRMEDDPSTEADEAHHFAPHYDLHVWLYRENPRGMFTQFNPAASCEHHKADGHH